MKSNILPRVLFAAALKTSTSYSSSTIFANLTRCHTRLLRMWLSNQIVITLRFQIGPMNVQLQCAFMDSNYSRTYVALIAKLSMRLLHRLVETIWLCKGECSDPLTRSW